MTLMEPPSDTKNRDIFCLCCAYLPGESPEQVVLCQLCGVIHPAFMALSTEYTYAHESRSPTLHEREGFPEPVRNPSFAFRPPTR